MEIRRATAFDNELLARLGSETFPGNFVRREPPAAMDSYIAKNFTPDVMADQLAESGSTFFIAFEGGEAVGFARLSEGRLSPDVTLLPSAELNRLYVVQAHWGQGLGHALVDECIEEAKARGCASVWLGAWSENERTLAFYRSIGFEEVGTQIFEIGEERHNDLVLQLELGS